MTENIAREIADLRVSFGRHDEQLKNIFARLDKQDELIAGINRLAGSVDKMGDGQLRLEKSMTMLRRDVDEMRQKQVKRASKLIWTAITAVISACAGYFASKLLGGNS